MQIPYSPQTSCSLVNDSDASIEASNTHISAILLAQVACHSIRLSYSLVVVLPLVSILVFRVSKFRLFRDYADMKSITLAVGLVLQNAAAAVQLSNMMRNLPQSVRLAETAGFSQSRSLARMLTDRIKQTRLFFSEYMRTT